MPESHERLSRSAWLDIAALGITQIIAYGTLYYSFGYGARLGHPKG